MLRVRVFSPLRRALGAVALVGLAAAAPLAGCANTGNVAGAIASTQQPLPSDVAALRAYADEWGRRYDANPGEKVASINYARSLRALSRYSEAAAVMQAAAGKGSNDFEVLGAYGKALADSGQFAQAKEVLARAYPPERPDWTILSVQGSVADRLGDREAAQSFYHEALKIAPGEPSVLNNLGLSYALDRQLPLAEDALRQACASPRADARTRNNLALVLALEGKFAEAEQASRQDMSPEAAAENVRGIREMIAQNDSWRDLRAGAKAKSAKSPRPPAAAPTPAAAAPLASDRSPG